MFSLKIIKVLKTNKAPHLLEYFAIGLHLVLLAKEVPGPQTPVGAIQLHRSLQEVINGGAVLKQGGGQLSCPTHLHRPVRTRRVARYGLTLRGKSVNSYCRMCNIWLWFVSYLSAFGKAQFLTNPVQCKVTSIST